MPKAKVDGIELYYEEHGSGPPLLMVAGLGGTGSYWGPQIAPFAEHFRVILHDHRGTGQSTPDTRTKYSVEQMAGDVIGLMDALGIEQAHLLGHSTGGAIGQVIAIEQPERLKSVVMYASWVKSDPFMRLIFDVRKTLLRKSGGAAYAHATPLFLYPDWWVNANAAALEELERKTVAAFPPIEIAISRCDAVVNFDREAELAGIRTPTLVICARDDFLTPQYCSEALAQGIPSADLMLLERGGHACSQTVVDEFNEATLSWLLAREKDTARTTT